MKKSIMFFCIFSAMTISLCACNNEADIITPINKNQTVVSISDSLNSTGKTGKNNQNAASVEEHTETAPKKKMEISKEIPMIGGSDTAFKLKYVNDAEDIYIICRIIGTEKCENWVENIYYKKSYEEQNDLPVLYQIIRDLNISKEDFVAQNNEFIDYPNMYYSEEIISALYSDDVSEMKKQLVNPLALYYDGEIYTFDELSQNQNAENASSIPADVMSEYIGFIESVCEENGIMKYMQEEIDDVKKTYQIYQEQSER